MDITGINISSVFDNAYTSWDDYLNRIGYDERNLIDSPETAKMKEALAAKNVVWCHNKSCSGKTYTAIRLVKPNRKRAVYNPCFYSSCSYEFVKLILALGRDFTLLADDIQCDIEKAKEIMSFVYTWKRTFASRNIRVFLVSWSSLLTNNEFIEYSTSIPTFTTNPEDYIELLKIKIPDESLLSVCGENIALLNAASKITDKSTEDAKTKLFRVFVLTDDNEKLKQIYKLCVLGIYEYTATRDFLGDPAITSADLNTLKITDSKYYAGHREICQYIASYIESMNVDGLQERSAIIRDYIMAVDNSQKFGTSFLPGRRWLLVSCKSPVGNGTSRHRAYAGRIFCF